MATVKVLKEFNDKHTNELHHVGDTFEADDSRIAEIQSVSMHLIQVLPDADEAPVKKTTRSRKKVD